MMKTIYALMFAFLIVLSPMAYAAPSSRFDVSIDRVLLNGQPLASGRNNLIAESASFSVSVEFTSLADTNNAHVEVFLRDSRSGNTIAAASNAENILNGQRYTKTFMINLADPFDDSSSFDLLVKVVDSQGRSEQKTYGLRTEDSVSSSGSGFRASIDRVLVNSKAISQSAQNLIQENDLLNFQVEITAVEDLEDAHVEVALRDRNSGYSLSDSSSNFDLDEDASRTITLTATLIDPIKDSGNFELTVKIVDALGRTASKTYGIVTDEAKLSSNANAIGTLDVSVDRVEIEDEIVAESQTNYLRISQKTKKIDVDVSLTALEDADKARVNAVLTYENGDVVADTTANFDFTDDSSVTKKLELPLLASFEQGIFRLAIKVSNEDGDFTEKIYTLKLATNNFPVFIESIMLEPENEAYAGKSIIAKVQMENTGLVSLSGMTATVSIPELGVSLSRFLGDSKTGQEITEEFVLKIPESAGSGQYTVLAEVSQQFSSDKESKQIHVKIVGADEQIHVADDKLVITVPVTRQEIEKNKEIVYPMTFKNEGPLAKTYTIGIENNWADVRLSDSNAFVLKPGQSKSMNVYVLTDDKFSGTKSVTLSVNDNDGQLSTIRLDAVMNAQTWYYIFGGKLALMILLILAVAALVVYAAYEGMNKFKGEDAEEGAEETELIQPEPYY